jgi:beta-carotene hydroxylase
MTDTLPDLDDLGPDLVKITTFRRRLALTRPFLYLAGYVAAAQTGHWLLAIGAMFLLFCADISLMHDVVHGTLGLRRRGTDRTLFVAGALVLVSGHAYRRTHQQHHKVFPGPDDPEGEAARMTPLRCLLDGPLHVARIWLWAFRRAPRRGWLLAEAAVPFAALAAGIAVWPWAPGLLVYVVLAIAAGWLYPLLTVHLPHHDYGEDRLTHARTLRGRLLPTLLLEQTYHLEHHLYPRVPSYKLPELARRLDPYLLAAGVRPRHVP